MPEIFSQKMSFQMEKPNLKSTTLVAALSVAVGAGDLDSLNSASLHSVGTSIEQIRVLSHQGATLNEIFANVENLAGEISKINADIHTHFAQITQSEFHQLLLVNQALGFAFFFLKAEFHSEILTHFRREFRVFSNAKNRFESQLQQLKERLYGVEIVEVEGLSLSKEELAQMTAELNARS